MRHWTAITLAVLCVAGVLSCSTALAQQSEDGRSVVTKIIPRYPDLARSLKLTGAVRVEAVVGPDGNVKSMRAVGGNQSY
jgi:hypothetical protein